MALAALVLAGTAGLDHPAADAGTPGSSLPRMPSVAAWGLGLPAAHYRSVTVWVAPHPDDEESLWASQLNTSTGSFPVYVVLTNGENTAACIGDGPIQYAPAGNLGAQDLPPFNTAGDLPGAPAGYVGPGHPPEFDGAQGDDPPVFPVDPPMDVTTGWAPLENAASVSRSGSDGTVWSEGFDGACRASRLAAITAMLSYTNAEVTALSGASDRSAYPSVSVGQPPTGQQCFSAPMGEVYVSGSGRYATPGGDGTWTAASTPPGISSAKDPCAYYWQTPTGDLFVFNLGDGSMGYRSACPADLGGQLRSGAPWPGGSNGYDSTGAYPAGSVPGDGRCGVSLAAGQESYGVTPSDAVWAAQQVSASALLPSGLPVVALRAASWVDGFNPAPTAPDALGGIDVSASRATTTCAFGMDATTRCPADAPSAVPSCQHYAPAGHWAAGSAAQLNTAVAGVPSAAAVCAGDPLATLTFATGAPSDGLRFWTRVFGDDSTTGWQASSRAYGWMQGVGGFDPYGTVVDTCPGSPAIYALGQSEFSCQESLTGRAPGTPATPGDGVEGMSNVYTDPSGHGLSRPL